MKNVLLFISLISIGFQAFGQIVINELDCDSPGIDDKEFLELKSDFPNFSTDGYVVVFFNGSASGNNTSYFTINLDGYITDENGLLLIGSDKVTPFPQLLIPPNTIQNGADAVAIYLGSDLDFPDQTMATIDDLVDVLIYDTSDPDAVDLIDIFSSHPNFTDIQQINEGSANNSNSIQRNTNGSYTAKSPTPRALNDGSGVRFNGISIETDAEHYQEGDTVNITFTSQFNVDSDLTFSFSLDYNGFNSSDFTGSTTVTIPNGQNTVSTTISIINDAEDEGDEEPLIKFVNLVSPYIPFNNFVKLRVIDDDFTQANFGTPINATYGNVTSTQPNSYYNSLDGLADNNLKQSLQDIVADPTVVRAQSYADVIDILKEADQNPENSNQVWLVYLEQGRAKLDYQLSSISTGKWNREHTFPRSRAGYYSIEEDEIADGKDIFWETKADSLRHGNSDAHALRVADGPENSSRGNQFYGEYNGPTGTLGSFKGDVARGVFYLAVRYNGLDIVNGFPSGYTGQLGDLQTLLEWHRNDPPDDFEMNRNNIIYNWQYNRNPFIDQPDLIEYIWGDMIGETWSQPLSMEKNTIDSVSVYPNPTNGRIFIKGLNNNAKVTVYAVDGRVLYIETLYNSYLDLNLSRGVYLLQITSEDKTTIKKIMVK
ncbi:T9SS type A sorting domain-containing protein [Bizionia argentinensis JUB59]|uniref:T9SS type A sorting domain-containing protein n=1 Tax=Bizionia argentinensis JUB59 TaxID=1046627 RepID=G2ED41_9FLAO|nr:endonuclease [Bizionia argentinensis]EGV43660.1 T9SS type A sorting domain-containing protein [Bizionia argentinensis JUB59]